MSGLAGPVRRQFPRLRPASAEEMGILEAQMGRPPRGDILIAARCSRGAPAVILTPPFEGEGALPPLLWLTCPALHLEVGRLEGGGGVEAVREALGRGGPAAEAFAREEEEFAEMVLSIAPGRGGRLAGRLGRRGAAWGKPGAIKCLHAHVAYRLASGRGVVGGMCLERVKEKDGSWCERTPKICVPRHRD